MAEHIGIIGAMDVEVKDLIAILEGCQTREICSLVVSSGELFGKHVSIVQCGVGKVNAAMCATVLVSVLGCDCVINTGIAGSLAETVQVGDVVVATDAIHHDMDVSGLGYALGQIPGVDTFAFPMDEHMRECVLSLQLDTTLHSGRVATGDQFISSAKAREHIHTEFHALCAEMEGASIAQVAYRAHVPTLIIRSISDNADGSSPVEYPVFEAKAAEISTRITKALISML